MSLRPLGLAVLVAASASFAAPARALADGPPSPSCETERAAWTKDPQLTSSIALAACELAAQHFAESARIIAPYVASAGGTAKERTRIMQISDAAREHVLTVKVEVDQLDADVIVDGTSVGHSPLPIPLFLPAGSHTIVVQHQGRAPVQQTVGGAEGETTSALVRIIPLRHDYIGYDVPSTQPGPPPTGRSVPIIVIGSAAAGIAFAVGGVFTVLAIGKSSSVSDGQKAITANGGNTTSCAAPTSAFASDCAALHDSLTKRDSLANMAVASFLISGALLGATLAYAFWPTSKRRDPWEPSFAKRVRPEPLIGAGVGGVILKGSF